MQGSPTSQLEQGFHDLRRSFHVHCKQSFSKVINFKQVLLIITFRDGTLKHFKDRTPEDHFQKAGAEITLTTMF